MHSVLLFVEKPKYGQSPDQDRATRTTLEEFEKHRERLRECAAGILEIGECGFHIPLATATDWFAVLVNHCVGRGWSYRILFLEKEPQWILHPHPGA
jgi:hypothetical protein